MALVGTLGLLSVTSYLLTVELELVWMMISIFSL